MIKGVYIALLEILLFTASSTVVRNYVPPLQLLDGLMYYWFCFCVLTGFWEATYIMYYNKIIIYAKKLRRKKQSVWTNKYPLKYVFPSFLAKIFYAEYGAWADREYMSSRKGDYWARLIESSHAFCCALFAFSALVFTYHGNLYKANLVGIAGMGCQFMNSLLYMGEYLLQCSSVDSPNYDDYLFPLKKRVFMWINVFWLLFPMAIIINLLL